MNNKSKDQKVKNAIKDINNLDTAEAVKEYISGEDRPDVLDAANLQLEILGTNAPVPEALGVSPPALLQRID